MPGCKKKWKIVESLNPQNTKTYGKICSGFVCWVFSPTISKVAAGYLPVRGIMDVELTPFNQKACCSLVYILGGSSHLVDG